MKVTYLLASMGPRLCGRGDARLPSSGSRARTGFNGAAPLWARRYADHLPSWPSKRLRFNGAAPLWARR